jgi:pimeloyl-ACP methyl ester carboxylesterase
MNRQPERREITVQGIRLSYLEWGSADPCRPSLVVLHGLLAAAETFDRLVDGLDSHLHIVALDLPANGHSERSPTLDTTTAGLAGMILQFITLLGLDRPLLLGHSHGGLLALRLVATSPSEVRGLILIAPAHPFGGYRENVVRYYLSPFGSTAARLLFPYIPGWLYLYFFRQMPGTRDHFDREVLEPYLHSLRMPGTVPYTLQVLHSWHDDMDCLRADLEQAPLRLPMLVLWGERDLVVPSSTATALLQHLPGAQFVSLPTSGHLPNEEAPAECAMRIQTWLDEHFVNDSSAPAVVSVAAAGAIP